MRKLLSVTILTLSIYSAQAQIGGILKKATNAITGKKDTSLLSTSDVVSGLKEALTIGAQNSSSKLSVADGYFGNALLKIVMPPEAVKVESTLRKAGLGNKVDEAILSMNRAAEDAAKTAAPIFVDAITGMSINDAWNILKGNDSAATTYLKDKTVTSLTTAFRPIIETSLDKVNATQHWNTVFTAYNKIPLTKKVNTDLTAYVTERALSGLFVQLASEEKSIRKNPAARVTDLLKKVFN